MRRRLVVLGAGVLVLILALLAILIPEVRLGFAFLAVAILGGAWWVARRQPVAPVSAVELRVAAAAVFALGMAAALWLPPFDRHCPCPQRPGFDTPCCPANDHVVLRVVIALVAIVCSLALARAARAPRSMGRSPTGQGARS